MVRENTHIHGDFYKTICRFLSSTSQTGREWDCMFTVLKSKNYQQGILYLAKLSFRNVGEIESLPVSQTNKM